MENTSCGLNLLILETAATGYEKAVPFLVSIPMKEKEFMCMMWMPVRRWSRNGRKMRRSRGPNLLRSQVAEEADCLRPVSCLVPMLAVSGLILFLVGWILRFGQRKES